MKRTPLTRIVEDLRARGFRMTRQRRAILDHLAETDAHPSAREVYDHVRRAHPGMTLATVYNTLGVLVRSGYLKHLDLEPAARYDTNPERHVNLVCLVCGTILDVGEGLPAVAEKLAEEAGFRVMDHRLEYYGVCAGCRTRGAAPADPKTASRAERHPAFPPAGRARESSS